MKSRFFAAMIALAVAGGCCLFGESGRADEDIFLTLKDTSDYGSGSTTIGTFSPGGLEGTGLFIGNPNNLTRKDRVLLKFDLGPVLLSADKIQNAKLIFSVEYFVGEEDFHQLDVGHFDEPVATLGAPELERADVETISMIDVSNDDAINRDGAVRGIPPFEVDVTEAVMKDLNQGHVNAVFRLSAPEVETKTTMKPSGLILVSAKTKLPVLQITLKN